MMRISVNGDLSQALRVLREGGRVSEAKQRQWFIPRAERRRLKAKRHRANLQLGASNNPPSGRGLTPTNEPAASITPRVTLGGLDGAR